MNEKWRDTKYHGYRISSFGRIEGPGNGKQGRKIMKLSPNHDGYYRVSMKVGGRKIARFVHGLVAEAFIGEKPNEKITVNHKNGIKNDNRVENLEYMTVKENIHHARDVLKVLGKGNGGYKKLTVSQVRDIRNIGTTLTYSEALKYADKFGVTAVTILNVRNGKTWKNI